MLSEYWREREEKEQYASHVQEHLHLIMPFSLEGTRLEVRSVMYGTFFKPEGTRGWMLETGSIAIYQRADHSLLGTRGSNSRGLGVDHEAKTSSP